LIRRTRGLMTFEREEIRTLDLKRDPRVPRLPRLSVVRFAAAPTSPPRQYERPRPKLPSDEPRPGGGRLYPENLNFPPAFQSARQRQLIRIFDVPAHRHAIADPRDAHAEGTQFFGEIGKSGRPAAVGSVERSFAHRAFLNPPEKLRPSALAGPIRPKRERPVQHRDSGPRKAFVFSMASTSGDSRHDANHHRIPGRVRAKAAKALSSVA